MARKYLPSNYRQNWLANNFCPGNTTDNQLLRWFGTTLITVQVTVILHSVSLLDKEVCGVWTMTLPCPKKFKRPHRTPTFNRPVSIPKSRLQMVYLDLVTSGWSDYCGKQLCNGYQHTLEPPFTKQQPLGGTGLRKTRAAASQQKPLSWEFMGNGSKKTPWNKIQIQRKPFLRGNHIDRKSVV